MFFTRFLSTLEVQTGTNIQQFFPLSRLKSPCLQKFSKAFFEVGSLGFPKRTHPSTPNLPVGFAPKTHRGTSLGGFCFGTSKTSEQDVPSLPLSSRRTEMENYVYRKICISYMCKLPQRKTKQDMDPLEALIYFKTARRLPSKTVQTLSSAKRPSLLFQTAQQVPSPGTLTLRVVFKRQEALVPVLPKICHCCLSC